MKYALGGAAPRGSSLSGVGTLRTEEFLWLPDPGAVGEASVKLDARADVVEIHLDTGQLSGKGLLAVNVESLCDPFTVIAPDRTNTLARSMGRFLMFRVEQKGLWQVQGLPEKGARSIPGEFSCRRFRVRFKGGLQSDVIYTHSSELKEYRFENDDPDADDEAELSVTVESDPTPLVVKAGEEVHEDYERKGDVIHIRGVRPNVTYRIEKLDAASVPSGK